MALSKKKESTQKVQSAKKTATKTPTPKSTSQSSPKVSTPTSSNTGRYDIAGKYLGAGSPVQLPGGRGMSAQMAAAVQRNPSAYPGYSDPSQGTPRYTYRSSSLYQGAVSRISPPSSWDSPV